MGAIICDGREPTEIHASTELSSIRLRESGKRDDIANQNNSFFEVRKHVAISCRGRIHRCELGLKQNRSGRWTAASLTGGQMRAVLPPLSLAVV